MQQKFLSTLFKEGELIGFKKEITSPVIYSLGEVAPNFFFLNPLKERRYGSGAGQVDNIAKFVNLLFEWDRADWTLEDQWAQAERMQLPWSTCVYSGGKSLHFIVSLDDGFTSADMYTYYGRLAMKVMESDQSMSNPNRISRFGGAVRKETGKVQEIIEIREGARITTAQFLDWLEFNPNTRSKFAAIKRAEAEMERQRLKDEALNPDVGPKTILPKIYKDIVEAGKLHPDTNSRHETLVKFAAWLKNNWQEQENCANLIRDAANAMGIGHRSDADSVIKYFKLEE